MAALSSSSASVTCCGTKAERGPGGGGSSRSSGSKPAAKGFATRVSSLISAGTRGVAVGGSFLRRMLSSTSCAGLRGVAGAGGAEGMMESCGRSSRSGCTSRLSSGSRWRGGFSASARASLLQPSGACTTGARTGFTAPTLSATAGNGAVTTTPHLGHWSLRPAISGGTASLAPQPGQANLSRRGFKSSEGGNPVIPTIRKT